MTLEEIIENYATLVMITHHNIHDVDILDRNIGALNTQALADLKKAVVEGLPEIQKSHTYGSENAEVYRAYDAGQKAYKQDCIKVPSGECFGAFRVDSSAEFFAEFLSANMNGAVIPAPKNVIVCPTELIFFPNALVRAPKSMVAGWLL